MSSTAVAQRRAIGIVRVSQVNGRDGESFASPEVQRERIADACGREQMRLLDVLDEPDVSGGKPLIARTQLLAAVEAVEAGEADVIVVAYFDRLVRSLKVQAEVLERVEAAGGRVLAADVGEVQNRTAAGWLSATMLGMVAEYHNRVTAEKSRAAQERAVERGVLPWPNVPPGYVRGDDGALAVDAELAPTLVEAFRMRADGATIADVRAYLAAGGVERSYHGTQAVLASRVYLGQIHFGDLVNLAAHPPIIDAELFDRVQRVKASRGRRAKSDRLLARLAVMRCASCGRSMIAATQTQNGRRYPFYRCGAVRQDCDARAAISAERVEAVVVAEVQRLLADLSGTAGAGDGVAAATGDLERAQAAYDAGMRVLDPLEPAAVDRLTQLKQARDAARTALDDARANSSATTVAVTAGDWDELTFAEQRALLRAVIESVVVRPGRGDDRVTITPR